MGNGISADGMAIQRDPDGLRRGVAKITAIVGAGVYTVTEQWRTAAGANQNAVSPPGRVAFSARDINARTTGEVDDLIVFWEARKIDASIETLTDLSLSADDNKVKVTSNDTTPGYLLAKIVGDGGNIGTPVEVGDGGDEDVKIVHAVPQQTGTFKVSDIEAGGWVKVMDMEIDANGHIVAIQDSTSTWHQTADQ